MKSIAKSPKASMRFALSSELASQAARHEGAGSEPNVAENSDDVRNIDAAIGIAVTTDECCGGIEGQAFGAALDFEVASETTGQEEAVSKGSACSGLLFYDVVWAGDPWHEYPAIETGVLGAQ